MGAESSSFYDDVPKAVILSDSKSLGEIDMDSIPEGVDFDPSVPNVAETYPAQTLAEMSAEQRIPLPGIAQPEISAPMDIDLEPTPAELQAEGDRLADEIRRKMDAMKPDIELT